MNAANAVQLLIVVWTFSSFCQADDEITVSCDNVTGTVGKEVTFNCSVSLRDTNCCIKMYKFQYPEIYNPSEICREVPPVNPCEQRKSITCHHIHTNTAMKEQIIFFVQTSCGKKTTEFTVDSEGEFKKIVSGTSSSSAIAAVVGCFILFIFIV